MSDNEDAKRKAAAQLDAGEVFGFGLSEQTHGADVYQTDMILTPSEHGWTANGEKYYIGNANVARDGVHLRQDRGHRRVRVLRRRLPARPLRADQERRQLAELCRQLRAARLPGHRGRHPAPRPRGLPRRAQHRQRVQVQPRVGCDRHVHPRHVRGGHPRVQPLPVRHRRHRLHPRAAPAHRCLRAAGRDEAGRHPRLRLHAQRFGRTTVATCSTAR